MAVSLKHSKTSAQADGGNTALVQPSDWNAEHVLSQGTGKLLGRTTVGDGPTEEISVGSGLSFSAGSISVNFSGYAPLASPTFTGTATFADASVGGNIALTGTGRRIGGDTVNATLANRLFWQDTTTNAITAFGVIPNGTATDSFVQLFNNSDPTNASILGLQVSTTATALQSTKVGTGNYLPLLFTVGGSEQMRVTTGGNVGVGTSAPASKLDINGGMATNVVAVAASAIDCSLGTVFTKTASGALTWTFTNVPASRAFTAILELTNGGTGTQTWPVAVKWPAGTAPTLTTAGVDVFAFFTDDGGTTWRGVLLMKDSK